MNTKFQTSRSVKAAKSSLTPMQKVFVDCEERRRSMFLYVARELTGRALQKRYIAEDKNLDWTKFNEYFESGYEQYSADEIRDEIIANVYWIKSEVQIIELYFRYLDDVRKNSAQTKNNKSKDDSFDFSA